MHTIKWGRPRKYHSCLLWGVKNNFRNILKWNGPLAWNYFGDRITTPMFIDAQANMLHYYFGALPAPWNIPFNEIILKCSRTNCFAQDPCLAFSMIYEHIHFLTTSLWELPCQNGQKSDLEQIMLGGGGTQTSKNSSATIFNIKGKPVEKPRMNYFLGGLVPHAIQIKSN